jgi:hypothetical protein
MNKKCFAMRRLSRFFCVFIFVFSMLAASSAFCGEAVNVILKNASSATVELELIDQYGGNFTASVDAGMSQNQTLKANSEIKIGGKAVHVVTAEDEGKEVVVAGP